MLRMYLLGIIVVSCMSLSAQNVAYPEWSTFEMHGREAVPINLDSVKMMLGSPPVEVDGKVVFRILVDAQGKYVRHLVLRTPHSLMTDYFEPLVPCIGWTPAETNGKKVASWVTIPFQVCLKR